MKKLAENDLTYFYLRHVVIVVTAVETISLPPVIMHLLFLMFRRHHEHLNREKYTICLTAQSFMDYIG
jgi:hypothetical protein